MPVTHVSMWSQNKWVRVSARDAAKRYPYGASVHQGLFICDKCQQYVTLVNSKYSESHFRHSRGETDKNCEDRSLSNSFSFDPSEHTLPLKLLIHSSTFEFAIGIMPLPDNIINSNPTAQIMVGYRGVKAGKISDKKTTFSFERLEAGATTYIPVGTYPTFQYSISTTITNKIIQQMIPATVEGIRTSGTLFDSSGNKRIPYDADVQIDHKYYLVSTERFEYPYKPVSEGISIKMLMKMELPVGYLRLYEVQANRWCEGAAKFFIELHARLTENPVKVEMLWPRHISNPYSIKYDDKACYLSVTGESVEAKVYPSSLCDSETTHEGTLVRLIPGDSRLLLSAGRTNVLRSIFLFKERLDFIGDRPAVEVKTIDGDEINSDEISKLPIQNCLCISAPFDGKVVVLYRKLTALKCHLKSGNVLQIGDLKLGARIEIYQGNDLIRRIEIVKKKKQSAEISEDVILARLNKCRNDMVPVPHSIGAVGSRLLEYPKVRSWLLKEIRSGYISKSAYLELMKEFGKGEVRWQTK